MQKLLLLDTSRGLSLPVLVKSISIEQHKSLLTPLHLIGTVFYLERKTRTPLAQFSSSAEQLINHCLKEETTEMLPRGSKGLAGPFQDHLSLLISGTDIAN